MLSPLSLTFLSILLILVASRFARSLIWVPWSIERRLRRQGVRGPSRHPISGNAGDIRRLIAAANKAKPIHGDFDHGGVVGPVLPHYELWTRLYGKTFLFWFGSKPRLVVREPELIKEVMLDRAGSFERVRFNPLSKHLFGEGLVGLDGAKWVQHRRVISPAFNIERVKGWVPAIVTSTLKMLEGWGRDSEGREFELDMHKELHNFTADVISRVAFGSCFEEGKQIFQMQEEQMHLVSIALRSIYIPGFRFLPTKRNRKRWQLDKEIRRLLRNLIEANGEASENSKNLLGLMISANKCQEDEKDQMTIDDIIDECKTFYFAGKDTTANLLTWALLLLALHQDWQRKAHEEIFQVCGSHHEPPNADHLSHLKILGMIINETLRLYPPAVFLMRQTTKDVRLGGLEIPSGTQLYMPTIAVHRDTQIWGEDAHRFDPSRFIEQRMHLASFFPFGLGQRICVGQNLALVEAKIALVMVLQRFSLAISPSYVHAPMLLLTLQPQFGAQILLRKI
ncbi:hypothetical protein QJS10_CPB19g00482 [Acorus calamus]|uniref:Cytochrome P450 n=1 Tax=Acorus calamus TaxID=4465 RepID=A0AAV9CHW9_ACOCL|nr:hypothetical protein QJS10_CPB19g00482 [Acorus calamus]